MLVYVCLALQASACLALHATEDNAGGYLSSQQHQQVDPEELYRSQFVPPRGGPLPQASVGGLNQAGEAFEQQQQQQQQQQTPQQMPLSKRFGAHFRELAKNTHRGVVKESSPAIENIRQDFAELSHKIRTHPKVVDGMTKARPHIEAMRQRAQPLVTRLGAFGAKASQKYAEHKQKRAQRGQASGEQQQQQREEMQPMQGQHSQQSYQ